MATVTGTKRLLDISGNNISTAVSLEASGTLLDVNGAAGTSGQVLSSTGTTVDWVDPSTVIGGPYVTIGTVQTITAAKTFSALLTGTAATFTGIVTASGGTSTQWNTAYSNNLKWSGVSTGLTASTGRTSLGGTTIGQNMFTLTNPGAVRFPRFDAANTVTALTASAFRTAIGAGTSSSTGTVTSIATSTGLTGGTITNTGTLSLATAGPGAAVYGSTSNQTKIDTITLDDYGRVTAVATGATGQVNTVATGNASTLNSSGSTAKILTPVTAAVSSASAALATGAQIQTAIDTATTGVLDYQGAWNANTNNPNLTSSVGTSGDYYIVSVAGNTSLNGENDWAVGDWAVFHTTWTKIDNTQVGNVTGSGVNARVPYWNSASNLTSMASFTFNGSSLYVPSNIYASGGNSTEWNTAYDKTLQWDGGSIALVAATGRTSLGLGSLATLSSVAAGQIDANAVNASELNVSGNGTSTQYLRSDGDGTFTWATPTNTQGVTSINFKTDGTALNVNSNTITSSGTMTGIWQGTSGQYVNGLGDLTTFPSIPQGDITAVVAGNYLTGGGTSGSVTLNGDNTKLAHIVDSANATVTSGWITVAQASTGRKAGEIYVTDGESSDHSFIRIDWMRSYADSNFTVINCGGHSNRIQGVRVLQETADATYGPKYLQVKVTATSDYYVIITAPGSIPNYADLTAETPVLENTKTGYSLTGAQLEDLQNSSVGTDEGITVGGDLYVNGGDITLGGTGRIQGVDTVSSNTDAANKLYVDNAVSGVSSGVTSVSGTGTVSGLTLTGTVTSTGNLTLGGTLSLTSGNVTTALGFTPYNSTNPSGFTSFAEPGIFSGGGTPTLASGVTGAEIRTLIGAGTSSSAGVTSVATSGTINGLTLTGGTITSTGTVTLGGTLLISNSDWSGTALSVGNGGTGSSTASGARTNLGVVNDTGAPAILSNGSVPLLNTGITAAEVRSLIGAGTSSSTGTVTSVGTTGTVSGLTLTGTVTGSGTLTLGGTLSLTSANVTGGLGFTPYNATNPSGYTTNTGTTTASNTQTFTNKSGNISQWTNDSGYITSYSNTNIGNTNLSTPASASRTFTLGTSSTFVIQNSSAAYLAIFSESNTFLQNDVIIGAVSTTTSLLKFRGNSASGSTAISLRAPDTVSAAATYILPQLPGSANLVLSSTTNGTMSWEAAGSVTSVGTGGGLTGGTFTTSGTISPDYTGGSNIILAAADGSGTTLDVNDKLLFSDGAEDVQFCNVDDLPFSTTPSDVGLSSISNNGNTITGSLTLTSTLYVPSQISHVGDTTTKMQFSTGQWTVYTSNSARLQCNSTYTRVNQNFVSTGNITAYFSDERLKTKTGNIENALDKINSLEGFTYVENDLAKSLGFDNNKQQVGLSAQSVKAVLPEAVALAPIDYLEDELNNDGEPVSKSGEDYLTVDYSKLVPLLIEAVKELTSEVADLKSKLK